MIADLCLKPQTHAGVGKLFMLLSTWRSALAFTQKTTFSNQQQHLPHSQALASQFFLFPSFFTFLPKLLLSPMFFSLLPPFNYPSLRSCALSHNVRVDGLCQEVHPDLHNVATFSPLA